MPTPVVLVVIVFQLQLKIVTSHLFVYLTAIREVYKVNSCGLQDCEDIVL